MYDSYQKNMIEMDKKSWILIIVSIGIFVLIVSIGMIKLNESEKIEMLQRCTIQGTDVNTDISLSGVKLNIKMDIYNPNKKDLTLKKIEYVLFANDKKLGETTEMEELILKGETTTSLNIEHSLKISEIPSMIWNLIQHKGKITWKIEGTATIESWPSDMEVPFSFETE